MAVSNDYDFRLSSFTAEDLRQTSQLLLNVFPKAVQLTERYLHWLYLENPDGRTIGFNAWRGEELVGHMGAVPQQARLRGETARGLFFLNSAVAAAHRGCKIQSRISEAIFAEARDQGYDYCISTGNRFSTKPLLTRFELLGGVDARIGIGHPRRRRINTPPEFEREWSGEAFGWRLANPEKTYGLATLDEKLIVTAKAARGIDAILYDGPDQWDVAARQRPGPRLRVWLGLDPSIVWSRSAFLPIAMPLRPSPLNLVFKNLSGRHAPPDPDRTLFRALDFDAY